MAPLLFNLYLCAVIENETRRSRGQMVREYTSTTQSFSGYTKNSSILRLNKFQFADNAACLVFIREATIFKRTSKLLRSSG